MDPNVTFFTATERCTTTPKYAVVGELVQLQTNALVLKIIQEAIVKFTTVTVL